jgi:hypothetical protein
MSGCPAECGWCARRTAAAYRRVLKLEIVLFRRAGGRSLRQQQLSLTRDPQPVPVCTITISFRPSKSCFEHTARSPSKVSLRIAGNFFGLPLAFMSPNDNNSHL